MLVVCRTSFPLSIIASLALMDPTIFSRKWVPWEISPWSKPSQRIVCFFPVVPVTPPPSYELSHCAHSVIRSIISFPLVIYPILWGHQYYVPTALINCRDIPSHALDRIARFSSSQVAFSVLTIPSFTFFFPSTSWYFLALASGIALDHDTPFLLLS